MISRLAAEIESIAGRRGVLGLLAVLWLNMAMLPCAMAFQGSDDCPHCPPADEHASHHQMAPHADHNEAVAKSPCATVQTDCCDEIAANVDGRGSKLEQRPASDVAFAGPPLPANDNARGRANSRHTTDPPDLTASSPPIRTLYCVYLK
ncbi:MAG: hypothetical protein WBN07_16045 [Woeseiaceae bacterium]|jgi:hypothetical protein